jgi:GTP-binding protein YchF
MIATVNCGIVGLPNVGKSTIFSALTSAPAEAANYPFCTIDPNIGVVAVPDPRLDKIHSIIEADKLVPASTEFVDIAGLVKGASRGEGLGNQFLSNIRSVGIIAHVVRCFEDEDVVHVDGKVDPASDIETINIELALADLQSVEKRLEKNTRQVKTADPKLRQEAIAVQELLERVSEHLGEGKPVRSMELSDDDNARLRELFLITAKTQIYVCNVDENDIEGTSPAVQAVKAIAESEGAQVVVLSGKLEADIAALDDPEERAVFLEDSGLSDSGLSRLIRTAYSTLGLRTFFTAGGVENRAWTFKDGATAPQCAGVIHSDFERGFIKADVYHCDDLFEYGSEAAVKSAGKLRMEGKEYVVRDGDIMHFKFNV